MSLYLRLLQLVHFAWKIGIGRRLETGTSNIEPQLMLSSAIVSPTTLDSLSRPNSTCEALKPQAQENSIQFRRPLC